MGIGSRPPAGPTVVTYGPDPNQWVEVRRPDRDGPVPLVVHFHGGFWRSEYALDHARPFCAGLRRAGFATANVEYRRVGQDGGGWPGTLTDAQDALALVPRLVAEYDLDPDLVVVSGHSAGGHLALWAAGETTVPLAGVVPIGAVTDLAAAHQRRLSDGGTATSDLLGGTPDEVDDDRWTSASPIRRVPLDVPVVLVHGRHDQQVPVSQATDYATAARAAGGEAEVVEVDADHVAVLDASTDMFAAVVDAAKRLVGVSA